ncbi:ArsR/SmtB family transcription factor [Oceaniglobus roseus]|uniref:ArsR/SmtB family transcription factor n=1 Tax=Oceaniglobus roseus TaxID=1737570 RepID=UPI0012FFDD93|nr:helix-turn-helix domain-containing protein [Kandeliimicrobium roseum]
MIEDETRAPESAAPEGEPVPDVYFLEDIEQVKVLGDPLRYRMALLLARPMTCAGLARALDLTRPKAHYHLKQLEAVGVVKPHSQALSNGILEKFYVTAGRMLHFGKLMPRGGALPGNVSPETVGAISAFLAAMLQVSGDRTRAVADAEGLEDGYYFDFEARLTRDQFEDVRDRLVALSEDIIAMTKGQDGGADTVPFHLTNYLTRLTDPPGETGGETE